MNQKMVSVVTKKIEKLFTFAYPENSYGKESMIKSFIEFSHLATGVIHIVRSHEGRRDLLNNVCLRAKGRWLRRSST